MDVFIAALLVGLGLSTARGRRMISGAILYNAVRTLMRRFAK